jgi:hypothetical protein
MIILASIDTTPNPNSMKLNLSAALGVSGTFTKENSSSAPDAVKQLLNIHGVVSVFSAASFLTLNRDPRTDWQPILGAVEQIFTGNEKQESSVETQREVAEYHGQVKVRVQTFREIPVQVKVTDGMKEERVALPPRFGNTARELQTHFGADYLKERHWADWDVRYGTLTEVAREVADEIESLLDEASLNKKKVLALGELQAEPATMPTTTELKNASAVKLDSPDWNERFRAVQQLEASEDTLPHFVKALQDEKPQIRRWAAARLAGIKSAESVEALSQAMLTDSNVGVRRTAGDSLSDIGDPSALESMCQALSDPNKLVRWRAARFLAETGTEAVLPYLNKAKGDPEYEVRLEVEAAINHIAEGSKAALPVWKLMSQDY